MNNYFQVSSSYDVLADEYVAHSFEIVESVERDPYEGVEVATQRASIRARKLERPS
jgi:hypothetical protein